MKKIVLTGSAILALLVLVLLVTQSESPSSLPAQASPTPLVSESTPTQPVASTPTAPLATAPVVKPVNIAQLPSIPHDLLFLDQGNLVRWNHTTGQLETLSGNTTCYWASPDRRTVVLEIAKGGDLYEIALLDLASGAKTTLVETASRIIDLAISPDSQWVAYIQSETLPDEWHCRPDLVAFGIYPFSGPYPATIFSLHLGVSQGNESESPVEIGYCKEGEALGFCGRILWSPDSRSILWSDAEGVWSFELGASQAKLIIPQTLNQPDYFDNRVYYPWRWSPMGRYVLTTFQIFEGVTQVVLDTQTGKVAELPGTFTYGYPGSKPAWMADGRLFTIRPPLPSEYTDFPPAAIEIWRVDPQQPGMLVLENSILLDIAWEQIPTGDPAQLADGRLAFAILSRESGDDPARGLYFADPTSLAPRKVNPLPPSLSESFYFQSGIVWSPDGQGVILQDWSEYPMLLYAPTDGSAVYDLSLVIQGCCFTWLR